MAWFACPASPVKRGLRAAEVLRVQGRHVDGAGQEAAAERRVRHQADARARAGRPATVVSGSRAHSEYSLCTAVIGCTAYARRSSVVVHLGQAQVADLALGDQLGHGADGLLDLRGLRRAVQVVQVDHVHAQPGQRRLAGPLDVAALAADDPLVSPPARSMPNFVASCTSSRRRADGPADQHLVVPGAVGVGRVEERHAEVERPVDGGDRLVPVGLRRTTRSCPCSPGPGRRRSGSPSETLRMSLPVLS